MRKFLESKGVLAKKDYFPDDPEARLVDAFEDHGIMGPDPNSPRVCLTQTFKGKWNKEVVEILTAAFILAVKQGQYKPVQHIWPQMGEDEVRKRCQHKLYRTQCICRRRGKPVSDKLNRMYRRRQEVCLLIGTSHELLTFRRRTTEGGEYMSETVIETLRHGRAWDYCLMLSAHGVLATMRLTMIRNMRTQTRASRQSGVLI
jgi:hypothetical protein